MTKATGVNIAIPEHKSNPYSLYARLRAEAPVHPVILSDKQTAWLITRYEDVIVALTDKRFVKDRLNACACMGVERYRRRATCAPIEGAICDS